MDDADSDGESHLSIVRLTSNFIASDITGITCGLLGRRVVPFWVPVSEKEEPVER